MPPRRTKSPGKRFTPSKSRSNWVVAKFTDGNWYGAKISKRHDNGTFDVAFDDGDFLEMMASKDVLLAGSRVDARVKGSKLVFPGVIKAINGDGSCAVQYDDGSYDAKVKPDMIDAEDVDDAAPSSLPADFLPEPGTPPRVATPKTAKSELQRFLPFGILILACVGSLGALGVAIMRSMETDGK